MLKVLAGRPAPSRDPIADRARGLVLTPAWEEYFDRMGPTLNSIPNVINCLDLHDQAAAITATDFANGVTDYGVYRISWVHRIDQAASASSATQLTLTWTEEGAGQTFTGTNLIANTLTTRESNVILIHADASTTINYAVSYTSVGATPMTFELALVLERIRPLVYR